jgi:hypothetical protein
MKKIILTGTLAMFCAGLFAQTTNSGGLADKKGEMYLPEAGDWAIAFDASPFLNYFGGFLSSSGAKAPTAGFLTDNNTIVGKYYVDEQTAYRGILRIGIQSVSQNNIIDNSSNNLGSPAPFPYPTVTDQMSMSSHFIGLGVGMEKRKGKTRLQGYYGAELMFWLAGSSTSFTYGNSYSQSTNPNPLWTSNFSTGATSINLPRPTDSSAGSTFGISLLGFIGFEYFFMPKVSIGAEYTWGLTFASTGQGSVEREELNPTTAADQTDTYKTGSRSVFYLDDGVNSLFGSNESNFLSQSSASLNIIFHF